MNRRIDRPNLVFVFADQLRRQSLGYTGDPLARTPVIDQFARSSMSFTNAVATAPICAPMRASLFTGTYPSTNGMVINELRLNPSLRSIGHVLTEAGYDTGYIGKWHLWANELANHSDPKNSFVPPGPHRMGFDGYWAAHNFADRYYGAYYHTESPEKVSFGEGVFQPDGQTDLAIDYIRTRSRAVPFALFLAWEPPHDPWDDANTPERFRSAFADVDFPNPPNYRDDNDPYGDFWSMLSPRDREHLPAWRRNYYAMTSSLDWNFGRLLECLDEHGLSDETVVVFTSDHGEMFGAHGRRAKNIFYEEAARVPFLLRWPGPVPAGAECDVCLSTVDVTPTLASLLGLPVPTQWEGADLTSFALGSTGPEPEAALMQGMGAVAIFHDGFEWRAVRDKRYTFATYRRDGSEYLFDNLADPYQMRNLATVADHKQVADRLRSFMHTKMAQIGDTFEASTTYEANWTDGERRILRGSRPFTE